MFVVKLSGCMYACRGVRMYVRMYGCMEVAHQPKILTLILRMEIIPIQIKIVRLYLERPTSIFYCQALIKEILSVPLTR